MITLVLLIGSSVLEGISMGIRPLYFWVYAYTYERK